MLCHTECDMPTARMPHQMHGTFTERLDERDRVRDVLCHGEARTRAIPVLRKVMPHADCDDAMLARQRPEHRRPDAEIAQRTMHADQRRTAADLEVGHVMVVHAQVLH
jgi:hypothetical protein